MKKILIIGSLLALLSTTIICEDNVPMVSISRDDFIELKIGNYIHSFNEFDQSIVVMDNVISIGIYYDKATQDRKRAIQLEKRFEEQIMFILEKYSWGSVYKVKVNVWEEDRMNTGY